MTLDEDIPVVTSRCPFCGGTFSAGTFNNDSPSEKFDGIVHTLPYCKEFESLDPDEFVAAVNDRLGLGRC